MKFAAFLRKRLKHPKKLKLHEQNFAQKLFSLKKLVPDFMSEEEIKNFARTEGIYELGEKAALSLFRQYREKYPAPESRDCLNEDDIKKIKKVLRQVWSWSHSRRLVQKRCDYGGGYAKCEQCRKRCPKIYIDHIEPVGTFDPKTYIERLFIPSDKLQGLCQKCHQAKTKTENAARRKSHAVGDFF